MSGDSYFEREDVVLTSAVCEKAESRDELRISKDDEKKEEGDETRLRADDDEIGLLG